ncbi:hypothetical protein QAD02_004175 [Eretmocerus hayati]|uniref:Uncharacterized protein n=1 Tax=Eretmocerus hayati TaxID=131215 RepID=A0ACC2NPA5_9HYME|nr:hypothetical protein QAD02_004175 [Eretmocerus hayati]
MRRRGGNGSLISYLEIFKYVAAFGIYSRVFVLPCSTLVTLFPVYRYKNGPSQQQRRKAKPYVAFLQRKFNATYKTNIKLTLLDCFRKTEFQVFAEQLAKLKGDYTPIFIEAEPLSPRLRIQEQLPAQPTHQAPNRKEHQNHYPPPQRFSAVGRDKAANEGPPAPPVLTQPLSPVNAGESQGKRGGEQYSTPPLLVYLDPSKGLQATGSPAPGGSSGDSQQQEGGLGDLIFGELLSRRPISPLPSDTPERDSREFLSTPPPPAPTLRGASSTGSEESQELGEPSTGQLSASDLSQIREGYETWPKQASAQESSPTSRSEHAEEDLLTCTSSGDLPPTSTTSDSPDTNKRGLPLGNQLAKKPRTTVKVSKLEVFRRGCERALGKPRRPSTKRSTVNQPSERQSDNTKCSVQLKSGGKYAVQPTLPPVRIPKHDPTVVIARATHEEIVPTAPKKTIVVTQPAAAKAKAVVQGEEVATSRSQQGASPCGTTAEERDSSKSYK